jgi:transcriptional regulator with XRE-family HTH domain
MDTIGEKIRRLRLEKKMTQKELSLRVRCTPAYISLLENSKADPSLSILKKISAVLDTTIIDFFRTDYEEKIVLRENEREIFQIPKSGTTLEMLVPNPGNKKIDARLAVVEPGGSSRGAYHHEGEEFGYLIKGEIELRYNGERFSLKKGDSFYLQSPIGHQYTNKGKEEAVILWVNHPPSF